MNDQMPDVAWFSPLLNEIAEVAGMRAALIIGRDYACRRLNVPKRIRPGCALVKLVGEEAALKLARRYGDTVLDIPPALSGQKRRRRRAITEMTMQGWSINRISQTLGISRSTVTDQRRTINRPAKLPTLFDMFPPEED